ncbi:Qc-SNARE protein, putative [Leishmania guyanensis]|uniref:t-SNARE coiled-coil homology domain-containing protein n=5 Tax=Viannia TaxID=37616 RepID=A4HDV6_LEIBR|nr:conserved hypothetical protein [Leishmania braziliensis MHOM/BR/75/M2904]CAJ2473953.1 unnamed protein product [Leishmania braziliensis]CCM16058.1 hypothetical protein, conserved [Leishmania guyanensis]CAJ2474467.1 unnamed protein product [Leishmania braziliensis]CAM39008.1 conserved hypothetical protein [Leishmania braziliensis MHOM/BR/75/M2904]SYZ66419.1 Qc-SNARE_protein [Leishmania braziliensis MHOM/BR/75/M2904]
MQSSLYGNSRVTKASSSASNRYEHMEEEIHRENEAMLQALSSSVKHMKAVAGHLNREAEEQNELLKSLDKAFQTARGGVHSAVNSVKSIMGRYGWRYTAVFGFMGFLLLYFIYAVFVKRA